MEEGDDEEQLLHSVALQNAKSILAARQRAEEALLEAKEALERKTEELAHSLAVMRAAEQALQKQSEWLRVTLASIGDAVITTDTEGYVTSLNPVAELLTGWAERDARGEPLERVFQIVSEDSRQTVENPALRSLREGEIVGLANHTILIAKDRTERAIDDSAAPIKDEQGTILGVVLIFRDVSEKRKDEDRLRQSEAQFRQLADALPQLVWTARPDGFLDYYNERWYEFTGFPRDEYGDLSWKPILHPDDVTACVEAYYGFIRAGALYRTEYRFKDRRTGGYRWFLGQAYPVRDELGRIVRWFGTYTDIDETKQAEQTSRFLADASTTLAELTDYQSTLQRVTSLAVPSFADWCAVDMWEADGSARRLAVTHADPARVKLAEELFRRYPPQAANRHGVMRVLQTGETEWVATIPDALLVELAKEEEHLRILRELGLKSFICVPLRSGDDDLRRPDVRHGGIGSGVRRHPPGGGGRPRPPCRHRGRERDPPRGAQGVRPAQGRVPGDAGP